MSDRMVIKKCLVCGYGYSFSFNKEHNRKEQLVKPPDQRNDFDKVDIFRKEHGLKPLK